MTFSTKKETRKHARAEWERFLGQGEARAALLEHVTAFLGAHLQAESRVLVSIALGDELDYLSVLGDFEQAVYAPVTLPEGRMDFRLLARDGRMLSAPVPGFMKIPGPPPEAELLPEPLLPADIALIPSLGTDAAGRRLGRGGGYYDRWKNRLIPARKIALLPETLTNLDFPAEDHDLRLDAVITENGFRESGS